MKCDYQRQPDRVIQSKSRVISLFNINGENIDKNVVDAFGEEWSKFNNYTDQRIKAAGEEYFDIIDENIVNKNTYVLDIGCGTGRWTKYLASKAGFIEAVDPSDAIFAADKVLNGVENVRLAKASIETLPFADETFDFVMSVGVLHHIPNTQQALTDCVKKVKKGGYFYVYLYYDLEKRGFLFKGAFRAANMLRNRVSRLSPKIKKPICDLLAVVVYLPLISTSRVLHLFGWRRLADKIPLSSYRNKSFFIVRNDALDRFGTRLEQRFSIREVKEMMLKAGLADIIISPGIPYYHAIGKKI